MRVGFCTISLRKMNLLEAIDRAADAGVQTIEVWGKAEGISSPTDFNTVGRFVEHVHSKGMDISVLGSYLNPAKALIENEYQQTMELAQRLGAQIVRVWAGIKTFEDPTQEEWNQCVQGLRKLAHSAEAHGLKIALEMHAGTYADSSRDTLRLLEMTEHASLGVIWQPFTHLESEDAEACLSKVAAYVLHVHAQNYKKSQASTQIQYERSLISEGFVDYPKVVEVLKARGYQGALAIEFLLGEFNTPSAQITALQRDAQYLHQLINS